MIGFHFGAEFAAGDVGWKAKKDKTQILIVAWPRLGNKQVRPRGVVAVAALPTGAIQATTRSLKTLYDEQLHSPD
jgi:hypothetical protein